ncbi:MAG: hypothetical protein ABW032_05120 [Burkholderiaceae bacterium]
MKIAAGKRLDARVCRPRAAQLREMGNIFACPTFEHSGISLRICPKEGIKLLQVDAVLSWMSDGLFSRESASPMSAAAGAISTPLASSLRRASDSRLLDIQPFSSKPIAISGAAGARLSAYLSGSLPNMEMGAPTATGPCPQADSSATPWSGSRTAAQGNPSSAKGPALKDRRKVSSLGPLELELPQAEPTESLSDAALHVATQQVLGAADRVASNVLRFANEVAAGIGAEVVLPPADTPLPSNADRQAMSAGQAWYARGSRSSPEERRPGAEGDYFEPAPAVPSIVKPYGSTYFKLHRKSQSFGPSTYSMNVQHLKTLVGDTLRLQFVLGGDIGTYAQRTQRGIEQFRRIVGVAADKVKIFFGKGSDYGAVHAVFTYGGSKFEVQFHTKDSCLARKEVYDDYKQSQRISLLIRSLAAASVPDGGVPAAASGQSQIRQQIEALERQRAVHDARRVRRFAEVGIPPDLHQIRLMRDGRALPRVAA